MDLEDRAVPKISVAELLEFTDKNLNEGSSIQFCQNFINEVMDASEGVGDHARVRNQLPSQNGNGAGSIKNLCNDDDGDKVEKGEAEMNDGGEADSKIREDGFLLFKNLCKLSMKFSSHDHPDDQILMRGKVLSLELLKVVMENAGPVWRANERQVSFLSSK